MIKEYKMIIWHRKFTLEVNYDLYPGEAVTESQINLLNYFLKNKNILVKAKKEIKRYCDLAINADEDNRKKEDIFDYIMPDYIFVKHDDIKPRLALMCKYKYDPEHGLAIIYEKDGTISIGPQDEIL